MKINFMRAIALSLGVMGFGGVAVADELISTPVETASNQVLVRTQYCTRTDPYSSTYLYLYNSYEYGTSIA